MKKNLLFILVGGLVIFGCDKECTNEQGECPEQQYEQDLALIEAYLEDNNLEAQVHPSGLHYIIKEEGTGDVPESGQRVLVDYTGMLLDGTIFDTSIDSVAREAGLYDEGRTYEPFRFTLGARQVIAGWDIGISLFKEGTSATLILPSYLGYGHNSTASIPGNSVLIFDVEFKDISF